MATAFYKLKEGNKLYKIDFVYDEEDNLIDYIPHNIEMARDASIENYMVRFICYDKSFNKNIMFKYDVHYNDDTKYFYDEDNSKCKVFLTTSKKRFESECNKLDKELNKNGEEGQDC